MYANQCAHGGSVHHKVIIEQGSAIQDKNNFCLLQALTK